MEEKEENRFFTWSDKQPGEEEPGCKWQQGGTYLGQSEPGETIWSSDCKMSH